MCISARAEVESRRVPISSGRPAARPVTPEDPIGARGSFIQRASAEPLNRKHWIALLILLAVEIVASIYLSSINPVQGYDENWYLLHAHHMRGDDSLPFQASRPPLLPLILAALGPWFWMSSGLAHIGSTILIFLTLRRLISSNLAALTGMVLFMVCDRLRIYNVYLLTELPSIFFMLLAVYAYVSSRPLIAGMSAVLAAFAHWSFLILPPVFLLAYLPGREWRSCRRAAIGCTLAAAPLLALLAADVGGILSPAARNLQINTSRANDWWYYVREFPQIPALLIVAGGVACWRLWRQWRRGTDLARLAPWLLIVTIVLSRLALLHAVSTKAPRLLLPLVPVLLLIAMHLIWQLAGDRRWVGRVACAAIFVNLMPTVSTFYRLRSFERDPTHALARLSAPLARYPDEPVYTDYNDVAVMGLLQRPSVAVLSEDSWHHALYDRPTCFRGDLPDGVLYLTWQPGLADVIAWEDAADGRRLSLVRWHSTPSDNMAQAGRNTVGVGVFR